VKNPALSAAAEMSGQVGLGRVGREEARRLGLDAAVAHRERVQRELVELAGEPIGVDAVALPLVLHVEEVSEHHVGRRALDRACERAVGAGALGLEEADVERDHARAAARQRVDQLRDPGPRPGPAPELVEALLVHDRQDDFGRRRDRAARLEAQVVGAQLDLVEQRECRASGRRGQWRRSRA
jgi:hypothetical protein